MPTLEERRITRRLCRYNFFYFAIVINKAKLYGPGFKVKGSFYKYASSLVFQNAQPHLTEATVVFDGSGTREFKRQGRRRKRQRNFRRVIAHREIYVQFWPKNKSPEP